MSRTPATRTRGHGTRRAPSCRAPPRQPSSPTHSKPTTSEDHAQHETSPTPLPQSEVNATLLHTASPSSPCEHPSRHPRRVLDRPSPSPTGIPPDMQGHRASHDTRSPVPRRRDANNHETVHTRPIQPYRPSDRRRETNPTQQYPPRSRPHSQPMRRRRDSHTSMPVPSREPSRPEPSNHHVSAPHCHP